LTAFNEDHPSNVTNAKVQHYDLDSKSSRQALSFFKDALFSIAPHNIMNPLPNALSNLSKDHSILLAAQYASESDLSSLRSLASLKQDVLPSETILRCILTYLPETLPPEQYVGFVDEVARGALSELDELEPLRTDSVKSLSNKKAHKRVKELHLLPLAEDFFPLSEYPEPIVQFLVHRAHLIEEQTGLLNLIPQLVAPFLSQFDNLRTWFISCVLPLVRLEYEFYPQGERLHTLQSIEFADDTKGVNIWLSKSLQTVTSKDSSWMRSSEIHSQNNLARDLRCLIGPWMYGESARKKRRLGRRHSLSNGDKFAEKRRNGAKSDVSAHPWDPIFNHLVQVAVENLPAVADAFQDWTGPADSDLGQPNISMHFTTDQEDELSNRYIQSQLAAIYASHGSDMSTLFSAYSVLARVSSALNLDSLPTFELQLEDLGSLSTPRTPFTTLPKSSTDADSLLNDNNVLTSVSEETFSLARHLLLSSRILLDFGHPISVSGVLKTKFYLDREDKESLAQKILHFMTTTSKISRSEWTVARKKLLWLWGWGEELSDTIQGKGIFGDIPRHSFEKDILEALVASGCKSSQNTVSMTCDLIDLGYAEVVSIYIDGNNDHTLSSDQIEQVIVSAALQQYDNASNGNKTRGSMKSASDMYVIPYLY
jgi:protein transport protein SEC39